MRIKVKLDKGETPNDARKGILLGFLAVAVIGIAIAALIDFCEWLF